MLMSPTPLRSVSVSNNDQSHRRRVGFELKLLEKPVRTNASTLYEMATYSFNNHTNEIGMKSREYLGISKSNKRMKEFAPGTIDLTYGQIGQQAHKFGAALIANGQMVAAPTTSSIEKNTKPCRIAIYENTWYVCVRIMRLVFVFVLSGVYGGFLCFCGLLSPCSIQFSKLSSYEISLRVSITVCLYL
jgi:hypothetical protein